MPDATSTAAATLLAARSAAVSAASGAGSPGAGRGGADPREAADVARVAALLTVEADPWSRVLPLHLTASALVVHPPSGRVLLRHHARQGTWLHVGGHADPGEHDPLAVALREAREETSLPDLRAWLDDHLVHVAVVPVTASATEPAHEHADLRFLLVTELPDEARPEKPDAPLRWVSPTEAAALTSSPSLQDLLRRVTPLL